MARQRQRYDMLFSILSRVVDWGLASTVIVAPLFMGGRGEIGSFVLVLLVCLTSVAWCLSQCLRNRRRFYFSGAELILVGGLVLIVLQLVPLPDSVLHSLSPEATRLLPLWQSSSSSPPQMGSWHSLSLTPFNTRSGLTMFVSYSMFFIVAFQRTRSRGDIERALRWTALAGILMATIGIAQLLAGNGKFMWVYEHPTRVASGVVKGMFANENHCGHFLAVCLPGILFWLVSRTHRSTRSADIFSSAGHRLSGDSYLSSCLWIGLGIVVFAGLMTVSRGGILALSISICACSMIYFWKSLISKKAVIFACALGAILWAALLIRGYDRLQWELARFQQTSSIDDLVHSRKELWSALWVAIPRFVHTGVGAGGHREIYRTYFPEHYNDIEFTHAESGYLQLLVEMGWPGMLLLIMTAAMLARSCWLTLRCSHSVNDAAIVGALSASLLVSFLHSIVDFVWYIPACLTIAILHAACAVRMSQLTNSRSSDSTRKSFARLAVRLNGSFAVSRWTAIATALVMIGVAVTISVSQFRAAVAGYYWEQYFRIARETQGLPSDTPHIAGSLREMERHLRSVLSYQPEHPRANIRLAVVNLRRFDLGSAEDGQSMQLVHIRDAALASQFPSRDALYQWLERAIGPRLRMLEESLRHSRLGLSQCPLQGEGYLYLAELSFLESPNRIKKQYIDQALLVRPYTPELQFAAGAEAALDGDVDKTLGFWKQAFGRDPEVQQQIIELLSSQMPPAAFLETFAPDEGALRRLYAYQRDFGSSEFAKQFAAVLAKQQVLAAQELSGKIAAGKWKDAADTLVFLEEHERAAECLERCVQLSPSNYQWRLRLARQMAKIGRFRDAEEHMRWCMSRKPDDESLLAELQQVTTQAHRHRAMRGPSPMDPDSAIR